MTMSEDEVVSTWRDGVVDAPLLADLFPAQPAKNVDVGINKICCPPNI